MKCDDCIYKSSYTTGRDEYPGLTTIEYCYKRHWENGPEPGIETGQSDPWHNCEDFEPKQISS